MWKFKRIVRLNVSADKNWLKNMFACMFRLRSHDYYWVGNDAPDVWSMKCTRNFRNRSSPTFLIGHAGVGLQAAFRFTLMRPNSILSLLRWLSIWMVFILARSLRFSTSTQCQSHRHFPSIFPPPRDSRNMRICFTISVIIKWSEQLQ